MPNVHCGDHLLPWETLSGLDCLSSVWHTRNQCFWQETEHSLKKAGQKYWSRRTPRKNDTENEKVGGNPKRKVTEETIGTKIYGDGKRSSAQRGKVMKVISLGGMHTWRSEHSEHLLHCSWLWNSAFECSMV